MATAIQNISHAAQRQTFKLIIDNLYDHIDNAEDRTKTYLKLVDKFEKYLGDGLDKEMIDKVRKGFQDPNNRWVRFINKIIDEADPTYAKKMLLNLGYEAFFHGTKTIRANREKYNCNIPWLILFDPTMACNMHCVGCWSGTYGHKSNLSYDDMDKIVSEGKELGVYLYMMTGGEPTTRMGEIFRLAEKHNDCFFALYSNSTLITDDVCEKVRQLGNITFMLSIEGTPDTNDSRRGTGHYEAVMTAMDRLKAHGIIFGTSVCYTRDNIEAVTSDEFFHLLERKGARFGFYFHLMPVGNNAAPELMPTIEQRRYMINRIREVRIRLIRKVLRRLIIYVQSATIMQENGDQLQMLSGLARCMTSQHMRIIVKRTEDTQESETLRDHRIQPLILLILKMPLKSIVRM
jgi:hypothetical protein